MTLWMASRSAAPRPAASHHHHSVSLLNATRDVSQAAKEQDGPGARRRELAERIALMPTSDAHRSRRSFTPPALRERIGEREVRPEGIRELAR